MDIRKVISTITAGLLIGLAGNAYAAEELVITSNTKAKFGVISLDIVTEGSAAAFQFNIALPKGVDPTQVNLSKCMADLPKTHKGECNVAKGQIIGIAYNDDGVSLPAGVVPIGTVSFSGKASSRAKLKVVNFVVSTSTAEVLPVATSVN